MNWKGHMRFLCSGSYHNKLFYRCLCGQPPGRRRQPKEGFLRCSFSTDREVTPSWVVLVCLLWPHHGRSPPPLPYLYLVLIWFQFLLIWHKINFDIKNCHASLAGFFLCSRILTFGVSKLKMFSHNITWGAVFYSNRSLAISYYVDAWCYSCSCSHCTLVLSTVCGLHFLLPKSILIKMLSWLLFVGSTNNNLFSPHINRSKLKVKNWISTSSELVSSLVICSQFHFSCSLTM